MSAREELERAIEGLTDDQLRTLTAWAGAFRRRAVMTGGEGSPGALADTLGISTEERGPGWTRMRLEVSPAWANPNGVLHGGVVYTLIDYSMGGALQPGLPQGDFCTSIDVKVSYLASVREGTLTAETHVIKEGRNVAFVESKVHDDKGRLVATGSGSMFIFRAGSQEAG